MTDNPLGILDTPLRIGSMGVVNRFLRSATHLYSADEDGTPNATIAGVYEELSRGDVGLMLSGYTFVTPEGRSSPRQVAIHEDRFIEPWRQVLAWVQPPTRVLLQLGHGGRQVRPEVAVGTPIAPSAVPCESYGTEPAAMTLEDLRRVRTAFVESAERAHRAGFDGVQLHAAHGFLLAQFLSPYANQRTDEYGGSTRARCRFLVEIVQGIRERLGDIPLLVKQNATDGHERGLQPDEAVEVAALLAGAGVDAIEVSGGSAEARQRATRTGPFALQDEGYYLAHAERIKAAVPIPVYATGGFRTLSLMRETVERGAVDGIGLCRPFIRDADLVQRFRGGLERSGCVACNLCYAPPEPVRCMARDDR